MVQFYRGGGRRVDGVWCMEEREVGVGVMEKGDFEDGDGEGGWVKWIRGTLNYIQSMSSVYESSNSNIIAQHIFPIRKSYNDHQPPPFHPPSLLQIQPHRFKTPPTPKTHDTSESSSAPNSAN